MARILIIGGGVAGLSAGIYARMSGHEATVCEKHVIAGGNLTGWSRGEYHIDNCIHWLTGSNPHSPLHQMWIDLGVLGNGVGTVQGNSLISCERDGIRLSLKPSLKDLYRDMTSISPEDEKEIRSFCSAVEFLMGVDNVAGEGCDEGLTAGRAFRGVGPLLKYYGLTTGQLAARFKHPALQCFITGFWGDDFGAFALLYVYATYCGKNGALPEGGSLRAAERMAEKFKSLGGTLHLKKEAAKIEVEGGVARAAVFTDGTRIEADYIVLTTDPAATFGKILNLPMPKKLKAQYDNPRLRPFSAYHAAFACDASELSFDGDLIFDVPDEHVEELGTKQLIVREFSHEPTFAPKGKNILQTITFCFGEDCDRFIRLRRENREAYKEKCQRLASVLQGLIEDHCPSLRGKLSLIDFWTPASYERFVGSRHGSFMSFAIPEKFLPIPLAQTVDGAGNLLLATQWLQSPGGLPIAANQGKNAILAINKRLKK